jgi:phosphoserine phosphatase RsbU/P
VPRGKPAPASSAVDDLGVGAASVSPGGEPDRGLAFLSDVGGRLVGATELDSAATLIVELAVPVLADCAVLVLPDARGRLDWWRWSQHTQSTRGRIRRPSVESAPALTAALDGLKRVDLLSPNEIAALPRAFAEPLTRHSEVAAVSLPPVPGSAPPGILVLGRRHGTWAHAEGHLMAEFAERVSRTVRATAQFELNRAATVALQSTLHPPTLPVLPGVRLSAIYRPSAGPVDVGGDFYDLFVLPDGSTLFTLGDVCGNGSEAAALSGRIRHALAALRLVETNPLVLLDLLNQALLGVTGSKFATAVVGNMTRRSGGALRLRMSSGGHPSPLILRKDGTVEVIAVPGMLVGIMPQAQFGENTVELAPDDMCVLYTDGITEARGNGDELFGSERLRETLAGCRGLPADQVTTRIDHTIQTWSGGTARDDIAVLAIQSAPTQ